MILHAYEDSVTLLCRIGNSLFRSPDLRRTGSICHNYALVFQTIGC